MNENGDTFDTRAWLFEHFNHPDMALMPSLLHCVLNVVCVCLLFYFLRIYNEWFVTRRSWSSVAGVLFGTSVSAC